MPAPSNGSRAKYLERRAIVPHPTLHKASKVESVPDIDNIQGDVCFMFPKRFERFLFFKIDNPSLFPDDLDSYLPRVTSARTTLANINHIHDKVPGDHDHVSTQIAFSRLGLNALGIHQRLRDDYFDQGSMKNKRSFLGDKANWDTVFDSGDVHGVIIVTAKNKDKCETEANAIQDLFKNSIKKRSMTVMEGRVRQGEAEFFGWKDGVSQPAMEGLNHPRPGQIVVNPGVIIMGYPGDPIFDDKNETQRPTFSKDGSFMIFRKLEQAVLSFQDYCNKNWTSVPKFPDNDTKLDDRTRKELFGARIVGRWKSGVPLALSPYKDNSYYAHPDRINNFDFTEATDPNQPFCPFASHIRKVVPRNLHPMVTKSFLQSSMVLRSGIPYGEEISPQDKKDYEAAIKKGEYEASNRGLLFVCYQSSIANGFVRQQTAFANNDFWPASTPIPTFRGQDPIIGGPPDKAQDDGVTLDVDLSKEGAVQLKVVSKDSTKYIINGFAKTENTSATAFQQDFFVTSRGGEWFFVPSISMLRKIRQIGGNNVNGGDVSTEDNDEDGNDGDNDGDNDANNDEDDDNDNDGENDGDNDGDNDGGSDVNNNEDGDSDNNEEEANEDSEEDSDKD